MGTANYHDVRYKKLFSNHTVVKELLISFVNETWVQNLDNKNEIISSVNSLKEVKDMFAQALKKQQREWFKMGMEKGMANTVSNLLNEGMDIKKVSKITGLSVEKIKKLNSKKTSRMSGRGLK